MSEVKELFLGHKPPEDVKAKNAHDFSFISMKDQSELPLEKFKGKVVIVVNVASLCVFTKQYRDLQTFYEEYQKKGVVVLAVPCNDFGKQEPKGNKEIKQFCRREFAITFPMVEKEATRGQYQHPFYEWARGVLGGINAPKWNFHKYVIDQEGQLVDFFIPFTKLTSKRARKVIDGLLKKDD